MQYHPKGFKSGNRVGELTDPNTSSAAKLKNAQKVDRTGRTQSIYYVVGRRCFWGSSRVSRLHQEKFYLLCSTTT
jgi:hypothetical protein